MSEKNNIYENDLLMRSILEGGQEEVPAHVWNGVAEGLDKAARKTVVLRWRRVAVSVAAVAAAVAAVLVLDRPEAETPILESVRGDMIAVVEPETENTKTVSQTSVARLIAYAPKETESVRQMATEFVSNDTPAMEEIDIAEKRHDMSSEDSSLEDKSTERKYVGQISEESQVAEESSAQAKVCFTDVWTDDEPTRRKVRTSLTVSGVTGASESTGHQNYNIQKAPPVFMAPAVTGIKEKNIPSRYGLPVSVGAGVKFDFTSRWSLGVGLNYTFLTRTFNGTYTHVGETGAIDNLVTSDIRNNQHFIGIPVNAYYNIIDRRVVNFYAYAGGTVEKCIYDKYQILSNSIIYKETAPGVQLSANIGLGVEFMLGKHVGLYIDPSLRYYFDCGQPKSIRTDQPLLMGAELGFRFRL